MGLPVTVSRHQCFRLPKSGNSAEECEDACAQNDSAGRFAIADGASESIFAGEWARELCEAFVADESSEDGMVAWLSEARKRWQAIVQEQPELWHVAEKLRDGSFATFLGLRITPTDRGGRWRAIAVGDSCLFIVRGRALAFAFPLDAAEQFGNRPALLGSRQEGNFRVAAASGELAGGDALYLMTDALAEWFLRQFASGGRPWKELDGLSDASFADWIQLQRQNRRLKNDDVTLLRIEMGVTQP